MKILQTLHSIRYHSSCSIYQGPRIGSGGLLSPPQARSGRSQGRPALGRRRQYHPFTRAQQAKVPRRSHSGRGRARRYRHQRRHGGRVSARVPLSARHRVPGDPCHAAVARRAVWAGDPCSHFSGAERGESCREGVLERPTERRLHLGPNERGRGVSGGQLEHDCGAHQHQRAVPALARLVSFLGPPLLGHGHHGEELASHVLLLLHHV